MYELLLSKQVSKFLKSRNRFEKTLIAQKFILLKESPNNSDKLDIKAMQGHKNIFRLRILSYRFIYEIKNKELLILVFRAGNRGDIYR